MSGLLISFDGLDSSGKATQVQQLINRLKTRRHTFRHYQSPDYATPSGQVLQQRLRGHIGDWRATSWKTKMQYFAQNRAEHKSAVLAALQAGAIVIYDRYVASSLAFIAAEALAAPATVISRVKIHAAVCREEYVKNGMPQENVAIFLDVPPRLAAALLTKRKKTSRHDDEYTDHILIQERLYNEYEYLLGQQPEKWLRIKCVSGQELLGVETVADLVWSGLVARFMELK